MGFVGSGLNNAEDTTTYWYVPTATTTDRTRHRKGFFREVRVIVTNEHTGSSCSATEKSIIPVASMQLQCYCKDAVTRNIAVKQAHPFLLHVCLHLPVLDIAMAAQCKVQPGGNNAQTTVSRVPVIHPVKR